MSDTRDVEAIFKAACKLKEAESELGRKLIVYANAGKDFEDLSRKIGIKVPLLRELTGVALGIRRRHPKTYEMMQKAS
jgi:hypothetical protein